MTFLETKNLGQKYGDRYVLEHIDLKIDKGEVFALIGPTGAGKTTLLRLLDFLEPPAAGKIYFDGIDVNCSRHNMLEVRRRMAFVQQKPVVFSMSVFDNVACGLRWRCEKGEIVQRKVEDTLEIVGMTKYRDRNAKTLSGGETQRVAVARVLVTDPEVLLLDEPTANLDPVSVSKVEEVLLDEPTANLDPVSVSKVEEVLAHIIGEHKITVVMATHDMSQGQRLADRIGVLVSGRILQLGSPSEIFTLPESREVAEFVGVENILAGVVAEKDNSLVTIEINGGCIEAISDYKVGEGVYVLIRPEEITLTLSKVVTKRSAEELNLTIGKRVHASFKASAISIIKRWN